MMRNYCSLLCVRPMVGDPLSIFCYNEGPYLCVTRGPPYRDKSFYLLDGRLYWYKYLDQIAIE